MLVNLIVVETGETYKDKDGNEKPQRNYYIETQAGARIAVKPSFKEDYKSFNVLADVKQPLVAKKK